MEDFDNAKTRNSKECVVTNLNSYLTYISDIKETIKKEEPLHKGDLVILDTDLLFRAQNFDERFLNSNINKEFYQLCEQRYQEEIKRKKNIIEKDRDELEI